MKYWTLIIAFYFLLHFLFYDMTVTRVYKIYVSSYYIRPSEIVIVELIVRANIF